MTELAELREWAVKQASKYDRKYAKYNDARAWVMAQRYAFIVELCDREMEREKA